MIMTFDFGLLAQRDAELMKKIKDALASEKDEIACTEFHKMSFSASKQTAVVEPLSENSPFHYKIMPKEIKYTAILKILNNDWDNICADEIMDV